MSIFFLGELGKPSFFFQTDSSTEQLAEFFNCSSRRTINKPNWLFWEKRTNDFDRCNLSPKVWCNYTDWSTNKNRTVYMNTQLYEFQLKCLYSISGDSFSNLAIEFAPKVYYTLNESNNLVMMIFLKATWSSHLYSLIKWVNCIMYHPLILFKLTSYSSVFVDSLIS